MRMKIQELRHAMRHEIRDEFIETFKEAVLPACLPSLDKGKMKMTYPSGSDSLSEHNGGDSDTSVTQEITEKAGKLCIAEKRKRGSERVFEDNSPMELPPKRTPKRGATKLVILCPRLTRSKAKEAGKKNGSEKKLSPVKTPLSHRVKNITPADKSATKGTLARMRFKNKVRLDLKDMDATELQRMCKEEGVLYDKKVDAIFDIVKRRATLAFGDEGATAEEIIQVESETCDHPAVIRGQ
ncbi:hypothetical protein CBR_g66683 [Chara braunii]|uniref:Uncharacterized protein n=1 Tax=Chara braunii TaxID=69332 RepID=A0A388JPY4_CHABU|nr:hypothetical protein CBR_g66683 [Chara braunii]|eukprot:GBG59876.1 hypothetical protein CBR_g66683 [Chara braunii]